MNLLPQVSIKFYPRTGITALVRLRPGTWWFMLHWLWLIKHRCLWLDFQITIKTLLNYFNILFLSSKKEWSKPWKKKKPGSLLEGLSAIADGVSRFKACVLTEIWIYLWESANLSWSSQVDEGTYLIRNLFSGNIPQMVLTVIKAA